MAFRFIFKPPPYHNLLKDFYIITKSFVTEFVSSWEKKELLRFDWRGQHLFSFFFWTFLNSRRLWSSTFPVVEARSLFFRINVSPREQRYLWGSFIWSRIRHSSWMKRVCCFGPSLSLMDTEKWQNEKWPLPDRSPARRQLNGHLVWPCENTSTLW